MYSKFLLVTSCSHEVWRFNQADSLDQFVQRLFRPEVEVGHIRVYVLMSCHAAMREVGQLRRRSLESRAVGSQWLAPRHHRFRTTVAMLRGYLGDLLQA